MDDLHEPGPDDVIAAAESAYQLFATLADLDWSATAGELVWDCRQTLEHVTTVQIFLASNAANQTRSRLPGARRPNPTRPVHRRELVDPCTRPRQAPSRRRPRSMRRGRPRLSTRAASQTATASPHACTETSSTHPTSPRAWASSSRLPRTSSQRRSRDSSPGSRTRATRGQPCSTRQAASPSARRNARRQTGGGTAPPSASGTARSRFGLPSRDPTHSDAKTR